MRNLQFNMKVNKMFLRRLQDKLKQFLTSSKKNKEPELKHLQKISCLRLIMKTFQEKVQRKFKILQVYIKNLRFYLMINQDQNYNWMFKALMKIKEHRRLMVLLTTKLPLVVKCLNSKVLLDLQLEMLLREDQSFLMKVILFLWNSKSIDHLGSLRNSRKNLLIIKSRLL